MNADCLKILFVLALAPLLHAQQSLETTYRTTGQSVVSAFEAQRAVLQTSSAVILDGRKERACGVVVSEDGWILTKSSELDDIAELVVTVDTTRYAQVRIAARDPKWDVALLKIEASGLVPVVYAASSDLPQGTWLVGNGASSRSHRRALPCIVSAKSRAIPVGGTGIMAGVALGVGLVEGGKRLEVDNVGDKSGAKEAGVRKGDVILAIDGKKVTKKDEVTEALKDRSSGSTVKLTLLRGKEELTLDVKLMARSEMMDPQANRNDQMSGDFSQRRTGFPRVMQTDLLANSSTVGGPLIDLDGRCVGMNISRANRSESYAIPVEELKGIVEQLRKSAQ